MDYIKKAIWGPDPKEQMRKCQSLIRKNKRQLDRSLSDLSPVEKKTTNLIKQAAKKGDMKTAKLYARELRNINKQRSRLYQSRATIDSIGMKLNEQQQMLKLQGSMQKSTEIMKEVSSLVKLPEISRTVQELSRELMKSGIIDEMVEDMMDNSEYDDMMMEDEEDEQVDELLKNILGDQTQKEPEVNMPEPVLSNEPAKQAEEEEDEDLIHNMRERLKALQE